MSYDTARPYLAAYVIVKKDGKFLSVFRTNTGWMDNHYGLSSGKAEKEEVVTESAIREAKEEVGIDIKPEDLKLVLTAHRLNKGDHAPEWIDIVFEASKWTGEPINAEPKVHGKIAWLDPNDMPENMIPAVRAYIEAISRGEMYLEFGWDENETGNSV